MLLFVSITKNERTKTKHPCLNDREMQFKYKRILKDWPSEFSAGKIFFKIFHGSKKTKLSKKLYVLSFLSVSFTKSVFIHVAEVFGDVGILKVVSSCFTSQKVYLNM